MLVLLVCFLFVCLPTRLICCLLTLKAASPNPTPGATCDACCTDSLILNIAVSRWGNENGSYKRTNKSTITC